jgi:peptidoglycan/xylan/chitin deacetylase (PgdA/CDA1 family)
MIFLCYHGVTNQKSKGIENFSGKHLRKDIFLEQMKTIKKKCKILDIHSIYFHLKNNIPFKKNSVAISFDDGFENNFSQAVPILKKFKIPAIFYICPLNIEKKQMFWVDKIETLIINSDREFFFLKTLNKNFYINTQKSKKQAILKIKNFCKNCSVKKKDDIINELIRKIGKKNLFKLNGNYKIATWSQIRITAKHDLFDIGGHSMEHNILTKIGKKNLNQEIKNCIDIIKRRTGIRVKHFSYPEGKFNVDVINTFKKFKILTSPIAEGHYNNKKTNVFKIKRIMVGFDKTKFPTF